VATVPDDSIATVQQDPLPGRAYPRLSDEASSQDFGAGLAQGIEKGGADIEAVQSERNREAKQAQKEAQAKADADADRVALANANISITQARNTIQFGKQQTDKNGNSIPDPNAAYSQSGPGIANMPERYGAAFDEQTAQITAGLTPHQQSLIAERVASEKDSLNLNLLRYQHEQGDREAQATFTTAKQSAIQDAALNYRDPDSTNRAREDLYNAGMALATRGGKDAVEAYKNGGYARDLDQLHESAIGAYLADGKPNGAEKYLQTWRGDLSSGTVLDTLQNHITAAQDRLEAKAKDGARDSYEDALKGSLAGLPGANRLVSDGQLALLHPTTWQRERTFLNNAADTGANEKKFDQMRPDAVIAAAQAAQPTVARPGVANDLLLAHMTQEAAQRSLSRRAADPAAFAIGTQGWQPLDFSNPQAAATQLNQRAQTAPQVSDQIGVRVPLLTKPESKQLADQLDQQDPKGRLQALTSLHQALPDERAYFSVMGQVMPHSPVTAIAGQKNDAPASPAAPTWYDARHLNDPQAAERILTGEQLLNPQRGQNAEEKSGYKGGMPMPSDAGGVGLRAYFSDHTKDVFRGRMELADDHYAAFRADYAARASEDGDVSGVYDSKRAKLALQDAVGARVSFNGRNVVPPSGMDPSKFEGLAENAVAQTAKASGAPADWDKRIKGYQLQEQGAVGSGRYTLVNGNAPLTRPDGKGDFVIDLRSQYAPSWEDK
jgi:hypothetical protein